PPVRRARASRPRPAWEPRRRAPARPARWAPARRARHPRPEPYPCGSYRWGSPAASRRPCSATPSASPGSNPAAGPDRGESRSLEAVRPGVGGVIRPTEGSGEHDLLAGHLDAPLGQRGAGRTVDDRAVGDGELAAVAVAVDRAVDHLGDRAPLVGAGGGERPELAGAGL